MMQDEARTPGDLPSYATLLQAALRQLSALVPITASFTERRTGQDRWIGQAAPVPAPYLNGPAHGLPAV